MIQSTVYETPEAFMFQQVIMARLLAPIVVLLLNASQPSQREEVLEVSKSSMNTDGLAVLRPASAVNSDFTSTGPPAKSITIHFLAHSLTLQMQHAIEQY